MMFIVITIIVVFVFVFLMVGIFKWHGDKQLNNTINNAIERNYLQHAETPTSVNFTHESSAPAPAVTERSAPPNATLRTDIQQKLKSTAKWTCRVCEFQSLITKKECVLCQTKQYEFSHQLNEVQLQARKRKLWVRIVDDYGQLYWFKNTEEDDQDIRMSEGFLVVPYPEGNTCKLGLTFIASKNLSAVDCLNYDVKLVQQISQYEFYDKYAWFLTQISSILKPYNDGHLDISIHRTQLLKDTFQLLRQIEGESLRKVWRVKFADEVGIDAGGVQREWYSLVSQSILDPSNGLFIANDENYYHINPNSAVEVGESRNYLEEFNSFGKLLGRAILDGQVLPFRFCVPFIKQIIGVPLSFSDLQDVDKTLYQSLKFIEDEKSVATLANMALTFSVNDSLGNAIELVHGGQDILVNQANKKQYLHLMWKHLMLDRIGPQLQSMSSGLNQVVPRDLLMVFDYKEFELLICGNSTIDVTDWIDNTAVSGALIADRSGRAVISWFWQIIVSLSESEKAKILQFATGSPRLPVQGFEGLTSYDGKICQFNLHLIPNLNGGKHQFIKAHTCFNRLHVPVYNTKAFLKKAIDVILKMEYFEFSME